MAVECIETQEWIEEKIWKPVDQWVTKTEEKCKKRKFYDPRRWLCWLVTTLIKIVTWILVTVGKWLVRTVCKTVGYIWEIIRDIFVGLWNILAGIFTWDWCRVGLGGLTIGGGVLDGLLGLGRIAVLLDTANYIAGEIRRQQLKTYVRTRLSHIYLGDKFRAIADNIRLESGAFGLRLNMTASRSYIDSESPKDRRPGEVPYLVQMHDAGVNVRELCGFEHNEGCFNRKRYKTIKKGLIATGGSGEPENPISEDELDLYMSSRGASGPAFLILCMTEDALNIQLRAAELKGRDIGIIPIWEKKMVEVTTKEDVIHDGKDGAQDHQLDLLKRKMNRTEGNAVAELCNPVALGVFQYANSLRGLASNLKPSKCGLGAHSVSGVTFVDNSPDIFRKYIVIHELGHYFGLCHVAGIDRIMFSPPKDKNGNTAGWWESLKSTLTWSTLPKLLLWEGEPSFIQDEAFAVWDYIIEHFEPGCLGVPQEPMVE